ncbi:tRNA lysidine(34) synthetase TilS [Psychrobacillus sp. NPDC058041]|uniref:tRNA lysidine(34) synthetase TilS n=1 Tax=Psychrobacillus sp. NPDC058041 TaxID=3346310 RepID=UPI0036DDBAAD
MLPFVQKVKKYIDKHKLIEEGERLLLACSGGADSVALVRVLYELQKEYACEIAIVHTDHQLRGEESEEDMRFVEQLAETLRIPFYGTKIEVPNRVSIEGGNVQVICREERYAYFERIMEKHKYQKLVLGHHAVDQIETVVMSLVRGTLASSITGIPMRRSFSVGEIIRPFLCVTKDEILDYIQLLHQNFRHDPSNDKHTYTRNRIRHKVVPFLVEENSHVSDKIQSFVEKQQQDDALLKVMAKEKFEQLVTINSNGNFFLDTMRFSEVPSALQRRVVLLLLNYLYNESEILLNDRLVESILSVCNECEGNMEIHLPNGFLLVRHYNTVQFTSSFHESPLPGEIVIQEDYWHDIGAGFSIYLTSNLNGNISNEKWFVQLENNSLPLFIRQKEEGDRIQVKGMSSPKKVSRLFIDEKVSAEDRRVWPLLVNQNNDILAVIGLRYEKRFSKEYQGQNYVIYLKQN